MTMNWLEGMHPQMGASPQLGGAALGQVGGLMASPIVMQVFAGQKLVVVGGGRHRPRRRADTDRIGRRPRRGRRRGHRRVLIAALPGAVPAAR